MTRKVVGRDGVARPAVSQGPDWRPGTTAVAREYRAEAGRLEGEAAAFMDTEARIARQVAGYTAPVLEPSGQMPFGPGRGGLETVEFDVVDAGAVAASRQTARVSARRRRGPRALSSMPRPLREAAARYAALVEAVGAPGLPVLDGPRGGGVSDGGASSRCALAMRLRSALKAIGDAPVLHPRGAQAHADRGRVVVTVRDLVDRVCVDAWTLEQLLHQRGWSRRHEHRRALIEALSHALERLDDVV